MGTPFLPQACQESPILNRALTCELCLLCSFDNSFICANQVVLCGLDLAYTVSRFFTVAQRRCVIGTTLLHPAIFPRLLAHWCFVVREFFSYLLAYKVLARLPARLPAYLLGRSARHLLVCVFVLARPLLALQFTIASANATSSVTTTRPGLRLTLRSWLRLFPSRLSPPNSGQRLPYIINPP
jgi:hypothetical protein